MSEPYYQDEAVTLYLGDALAVLSSLPSGSVDCCVTSPPYFGLRDYGVEGQYGLEASPAGYVETMRGVFAEVRRVISDDGTLWLNLGDSYLRGNAPTNTRNKSGHIARPAYGVPKNLLGIPWRVAFALQDNGWILRNDIVWHKTNAMPESATDRLHSRHEYLFMLSKSGRYWSDLGAIKVPAAAASVSRAKYALTKLRPGAVGSGAYPGEKRTEFQPWDASNLLDKGTNPGDVWSIPTQPYPDAHFAVMPQALAERCILAGCKPGGTVLDPFSGSGTTGLVATKHGRRYVGIDLNADYLDLSLRSRLSQATLDFGTTA